MTMEIKLTQNKVAIVDDEDYKYLSQYKWHAEKRRNTWYAVRNVKFPIRRSIRMHNEIIRGPSDTEVDHRNLNGLDNRRENLRIATRGQNRANAGKYKNNKTGYKGVCWVKRAQKYRAEIRVNGKGISLGVFDDPEEASKAYITAAKKIFGEFARS